MEGSKVGTPNIIHHFIKQGQRYLKLTSLLQEPVIRKSYFVNRKSPHSSDKLSTGFARADFTALEPTVKPVINKEQIMTKINRPEENGIL